MSGVRDVQPTTVSRVPAVEPRTSTVPAPSALVNSDANREAAASALDDVYELSELLGLDLSHKQLALIMALLQEGVSPDALASVVHDLKHYGSVSE